MTPSDHMHERPQWDCRACGLPWPCPTARAGLLEEYRGFPSLLKVYLSTQMYDALDDMIADGGAPPDLYDRFLAWARNRPQTP
ncbi:hypothetical protein AB0C07_25810 [Actinoplanes missouriensis]|uniref:hypothetical protein n=1 Tax=Actinoplanes missouriensis TaxID=1866 RepID=UPI00340834E6